MAAMKTFPSSTLFHYLLASLFTLFCFFPLYFAYDVNNGDDDGLRWNQVLWAGTHNSAINLGKGTLAKPSDAVLGNYPSEAYSPYQYLVMDQRLSIRDQLEGGIRFL